jgi:glucosamine-6-phosphate deaminase
VELVLVGAARAIGPVVVDAIAALVARSVAPVLGLATGSSPAPVYDELAARVAAGTLSLARVRAFLLDEYVGLDPRHPGSYRATIEREVVARTDLPPDAVTGPDGTADDLAAAGPAYDVAIAAAGGIDLQLLGIGSDGHIGFNEPTSSLASRTRVKTLTARTRVDNSRFFGGDPEAVPRHVLTQGIGTILTARHLVLVASGAGKAAAVAAAVEGPLTAFVPASALQLHPHATVVVDEAAASRLTLADYYRATWAEKPSWQGI